MLLVTILEDAILEATRTSDNIYRITLKRGTWNSYDPVPGGDLTGALQFMFGNNGDNAEAHFIDGSFFKASRITQRGGTIYFEGAAMRRAAASSSAMHTRTTPSSK